MTYYNALAEQITKNDVGRLSLIAENGYQIGNQRNLTAEEFCHNAEVVMAMMEKCKEGIVTYQKADGSWYARVPGGESATADSLRLAINRACAEVLEAT